MKLLVRNVWEMSVSMSVKVLPFSSPFGIPLGLSFVCPSSTQHTLSIKSGHPNGKGSLVIHPGAASSSPPGFAFLQKFLFSLHLNPLRMLSEGTFRMFEFWQEKNNFLAQLFPQRLPSYNYKLFIPTISSYVPLLNICPSEAAGLKKFNFSLPCCGLTIS